MNRKIFLVLILTAACCSIAMAKGRRPDDEDTDKFPDYNRIDMHARTKAPPTDAPAASDSPTSAPKPPALNNPVNPAGDDDLTPKAPPPAVPVSDGASEPPLPDEIKNNLIQGTTDQK